MTDLARRLAAAITGVRDELEARRRPDLPAPSATQRQLAQALREQAAHLFEAQDQGATAEWQAFGREFLKHLQRGDDPRAFLRWPVIRRTMFPGNPPYIGRELEWLRSQADWSTRWAAAVQETPTGSPPAYPGYPASSANALHHAFIAGQLEAQSSARWNELQLIVEFGGGYGEFCRLVRRLGFRGTYLIYDLPAFSMLQRYYLGMEGERLQATAGGDAGTWCVSTLTDVRAALAGRSVDLVVAMWSLSEAPVAVRDTFLAEIGPSGRHLLTFQDYFGGIDNVAYFANWASPTRSSIPASCPLVTGPSTVAS